MPLQRAIIEMPMSAGLQQQVDPYQLRDGLLGLENGAFAKTGAINKRRGFAALANDDPIDTNVSLGQSSFIGQGVEAGELLQISTGHTPLPSIAERLELGSRLWSHSNGWHPRARAFPIEVRIREVASDAGDLRCLDVAYTPAVQAGLPDAAPTHCCAVYAQMNGANSVAFAVVYDMATGTRTLLQQLSNVDATDDFHPKVIAQGTTFYIFTSGDSGGTGYVYFHTITDGRTYTPGERCNLSDSVYTPTFDVAAVIGGSTNYWVIEFTDDATGHNLVLDSLSLDCATLYDSEAIATGVFISAARHVHISPDSSDAPCIVATWVEENGASYRDVHFATWTMDGGGLMTAVRADTLVYTAAVADSVISVTTCPDTRDKDQAILFFTERTPSSPTGGTLARQNTRVQCWKVECVAGASVLLCLAQHTSIYSRPQIWDGRPHLVTFYQAWQGAGDVGRLSDQNAYHLMALHYDQDPHVVTPAYRLEVCGTFLDGSAIDLATGWTLTLPHLCGQNQTWHTMPAAPATGEAADCKQFGVPLARIDFEVENKDTGASFRAVVVCELDTHAWAQASQKATSTHIGETRQIALGGYVADYDGELAAEPNFLLRPEQLDFLVVAVGGSLAAGTYYYAATYEWTDAKGQIHISAPSPVRPGAGLAGAEVVLAGAVNIVEVWVPTLAHSASLDKLSDVRIQLYRTEADGSVLYRVPVASGRLDNVPGNNWVHFTDTGAYGAVTFPADTSALYTTGGVYENSAPPASNITCEHANRLVLVPNDDRTRVRYSKVRSANEGLSCPREFEIQTPQDTGEITAVASLFGRLVLIKKQAIYMVEGEGPNDLGGGQVFSPPAMISATVGCVSRGTVVPCGTSGLAFKSKGGICLLTSAFQVTDAPGKPVSDYDGWDMRVAAHLPREHQVRFLAKSGSSTVILVLDYDSGQWSVWTFAGALAPADFAVIGWTPASSSQDGFAYVYTSGTGSAAVSNACREHAGFQDVAAGGTTVEYALKVSSPWFAVGGLQGFQRLWWLHLLGKVLSAHTLTLRLFYDYAATHSEEQTIAQSVVGPLMARVKPALEKCTSFRYDVWDSINGKTEGYSLSATALVIGAKGRLAPLTRKKTAVPA